jgi:hypothetical protein
MFQSDDNISLFVALFDIPVRLNRLHQRIAAINNWFQQTHLKKFFEKNQFFCAWYKLSHR